jgi:hypothetical protein
VFKKGRKAKGKSKVTKSKKITKKSKPTKQPKLIETAAGVKIQDKEKANSFVIVGESSNVKGILKNSKEQKSESKVKRVTIDVEQSFEKKVEKKKEKAEKFNKRKKSSKKEHTPKKEETEKQQRSVRKRSNKRNSSKVK